MFQFIGDVIGHATARLLIPPLSFGRVRVQPILDKGGRFGWSGVRREPDGTYLVEAITAEWIGLFFWIAVLIAVIAVVR